MEFVSTTEFQSQLGRYLASTRKAPIVVQKSGEPLAVVVSPIEYQHLQELEDLYWLARAEAAEITGEWVTHHTAA